MKKISKDISSWSKEAVYLSRYAGSGVINTLVGFAVIFIAMIAGFSPMVSNIAGYAVGFILGFVLSKKFVFRSNGCFVAESMRYLIAFMVCFIFNLIALWVALNILGLHAMLAQFVAAGCYTMLMYLATRTYVFSPSIK